MKSMDEQALGPARVIWDYLQLRHQPIPADVIVAFGTNDLRVAQFAADLHLRGYGPTLVCTGGLAHQGDDPLATGWARPEAEMFADAAEARGVPRDRILIEPRALNTTENIRFTRELLESRGLKPRNVVLAMKPFVERRAWAVMAVEWPEMPATVASPRMSLDEYFTPELDPARVIDIMMGDLQRIWVYAGKGWSAPQRVPEEVHAAYRRLAGLGFTRRLLRET
jgi:hypothetical protein